MKLSFPVVILTCNVCHSFCLSFGGRHIKWMIRSVLRVMASKDPLDVLFFFSYTEHHSQSPVEASAQR